jgi:hypothetical protein
MSPTDLDPEEQAFIEQALSAAERATRADQIRVFVATAAAIAAAIWLPSGPPVRS